MTIQLSVTVWTIICFIALMLILHNLLFKPVLELLDKRNKKIEDAAKKKAEYEEMQRKNESLLIESKKVFLENRAQELKKKVESIKLENKIAAGKAGKLRLNMVEDYRIKTESEQAKILSTLEEHSTMLAVSFAQSLVKE